MFGYIWPLALVVAANTLYQVCTRSVPGDIDPFASLTATYLIGAAVSLIMYLALNRGGDLLREYRRLNWASVLLGVVIVALEGGWIYAYKAGWPVSTAQIVQCAVLGAILIFVGAVFYKEPLTWNKLVGIAICIVGLIFINMK